MAIPTVTSITPSTGTYSGGTTALIVGTGFTAATAVTIGGESADFAIASDTLLAVTIPAHDAGTAAVIVTNATGPSVNVVNVTYTGGPVLFTVADARAFDRLQLANPTLYPDAVITAAEARILEQFERICMVAFVPTTVTDEWYDGSGTTWLWLQHNKLISVTACACYDADTSVAETFDSSDLNDLAIYVDGRIMRRSLGLFPKGNHNVKITYKYGWAAVPAPITEAALIVCVNSLVAGNISDRATSFSDGNQTFALSTAGRPNQWFGLPNVDSTLQQYNETLPGIA